MRVPSKVSACCLVVLTGYALLHTSGVPVAHILTFSGYEIVFVVLPGIAAYSAISGEGLLSLRALAVGWAVGYVLEVLAYLAAQSLHAWPLFLVYPPLALAASALRIFTRPRADGRGRDVMTRSQTLAIAALSIVVMGYIGAAYFSPTPLARGAPHVSYATDFVFEVSLAAEAKHHWPLEEPMVAGEPLNYHPFPYQDMAAAARVTNLPLDEVVLRLYLLPMAVLAVLLVAWAGWALSGQRSIGLLAVVCVFLLGELDLDPVRAFLFSGGFNYLLLPWHGFLLALIFFVPLIVILYEEIALKRTRHGLAVIALLAVGCAGAKGIAVLPVLFGGLVLWMGWFFVTHRRIPTRGIQACAILAVILVGSAFSLYRGSGSAVELEPLAAFSDMPGAQSIRAAAARHGISVLGDAASVVVGVVAMLAVPFCGGLLALTLGGGVSVQRMWLLSLMLPGVVPLLLIRAPGGSQLDPLGYSYVAGALLAAEGAYLLGQRLVIERLPVRRMVAAGCGGIAILASLSVALFLTPVGDRAPFRGNELVWSYAVLMALLSTLTVVWLWRASARLRRFVVAPLLASVALATAVDAPLDSLPGVFHRSAGSTLWYSDQPDLTRGLLAGLKWVDRNTATDAVLAVNNQYIGAERVPEAANYLYYSAFSERRVFLEGWLYTSEATRLGYNDVVAGRAVAFPERQRINRAIFERADRGALEQAVRDYGVGYLVIDRTHNSASPRVGSLGRKVFGNVDVDIYAVD
jgi:hypothetical protein